MTFPALWDHQRQAIEKSFRVDHLGLFFEIGTGKSRTAIDIIRHKCAAKNELMRVLILCPKVVCENWRREFAKYSKIHHRDVVTLTGTGKQRLDEFKEKTAGRKPLIVITNYESLQMAPLFTALMDWQPEIMVADEAHRIKNPESVRAKKTIQLADRVKYKYALTGTPILNSAMDIFNIFRFLDGGETFGINFWKFRNVWFEDANASWSGRPGHFPKYVPRPDTYKEFSAMVSKKALRAVKSECLDLPPFVRKEIHVELSKEQRKLYEDMKKEYIAYVDDLEKTDQPRAVVAQLAVTKALRLQQIITGFAKTEEGEIYRIEENPRIDALRDLLSEHAADHKIIVWSVFHDNYSEITRVCRDLGLGFRELHGKVSGRDRDRNITDFCTKPEVRVLIANQAAGGIGINLVESDISIFYSKNFSLEQDLQAEGRNYRGGSEQHQKVTRIDLVATNTIDDLITQALAGKEEISKKILSWKAQI